MARGMGGHMGSMNIGAHMGMNNMHMNIHGFMGGSGGDMMGGNPMFGGGGHGGGGGGNGPSPGGGSNMMGSMGNFEGGGSMQGGGGGGYPNQDSQMVPYDNRGGQGHPSKSSGHSPKSNTSSSPHMMNRGQVPPYGPSDYDMNYGMPLSGRMNVNMNNRDMMQTWPNFNNMSHPGMWGSMQGGHGGGGDTKRQGRSSQDQGIEIVDERSNNYGRSIKRKRSDSDNE